MASIICSPQAHLGHRLTGPLRIEQDLQPELGHGHHPQAHAHLPVLLGKAGPVWVVSGMCPEHLSGMCPERSVRHVSRHHRLSRRSDVCKMFAHGSARRELERPVKGTNPQVGPEVPDGGMGHPPPVMRPVQSLPIRLRPREPKPQVKAQRRRTESNPPASSRPHTGFEVRGRSCCRV